jgi:hypothetical protein
LVPAVVLLGYDVARGWIALDSAQTLLAVVIFALAFPIVGWVVLRRWPGNRVGWVYLAIGFWQALNLFSNQYSNLAFEVASGNLPFASELSWIAVWAWTPGFTLFCTLACCSFPTADCRRGAGGRLSRWPLSRSASSRFPGRWPRGRIEASSSRRRRLRPMGTCRCPWLALACPRHPIEKPCERQHLVREVRGFAHSAADLAEPQTRCLGRGGALPGDYSQVVTRPIVNA